MASSTCASVATGDSVSLASDSVMRTMASSCRTVMGIDDRVLASSSDACTCLRICTKCDDSFSAASGLRRGAQRLGLSLVSFVISFGMVVHFGRDGATYDLQ